MPCSSKTYRSTRFSFSVSRRLVGYWPIQELLGFLQIVGRLHEGWCQRQELLDLDDHLLADIGISRDVAISEASKPLWRWASGETRHRRGCRQRRR